MKNLTYILVLLGCVFILRNCNRECDEVITVNLKELHKYVPYTGTETLRFLHNSTDTQTFVGQGMERFYVAYRKQEDGACREDHESVRIRFVNPQTQDEIKMEYVYDLSKSGNRFRFFYDGIKEANLIGTLQKSVNIGGYVYDYVGFYSSDDINISYLAFKNSIDGNYQGIIQIKYPNDSLIIIR